MEHQVELVLPYPPSANRYWRTYATKTTRSPVTVCSPEAREYRRTVAALAKAAGINSPIKGRVAVSIKLYPRRPRNWEKRAARDPDTWDDSVECIDLDNALKVLLDSLNAHVIEDDRWVRRIEAVRAVPDGDARVVVRVSRI